jgi:hypothetical protein
VETTVAPAPALAPAAPVVVLARVRPRRPRPPPPRRRFPWALLAADALLLHLLPVVGPGWPVVLLVQVAVFLPGHAVWWVERFDPPVASRVASRTWALAVAVGCLWLALARTEHGDPSLLRIAFYGSLVWAPVAMVERRWPEDVAPRVIFVCCAILLAFLVHLDLVSSSEFT